jgi:mitogen-activated protein kinase organizer 1
MYVYDVTSGEVLRRYHAHDQRINCVKYNMDCSVLVSASNDATVKMWDCRSNMRTPIQVISKVFKDSVTSLAVTDHEIMAASVDGTVRTFDVRSNACSIDHIQQSITHMTLSNDHNCILLSCMDDTVRLVDKNAGTLLNDYKGHKHSMYNLESCLTNSDSHVISGSEDGKIFIWELVDAKIVHTIDAHTRSVSSIAYHPNKKCMVTSSVDGIIKCYN